VRRSGGRRPWPPRTTRTSSEYPSVAVHSESRSALSRQPQPVAASHSASVGEVVEAEVRLPEASGRHRIEVLPDRPGVQVLGSREFWTDGAAPTTVRFTCATPGRAGISVLVKE